MNSKKKYFLINPKIGGNIKLDTKAYSPAEAGKKIYYNLFSNIAPKIKYFYFTIYCIDNDCIYHLKAIERHDREMCKIDKVDENELDYEISCSDGEIDEKIINKFLDLCKFKNKTKDTFGGTLQKNKFNSKYFEDDSFLESDSDKDSDSDEDEEDQEDEEDKEYRDNGKDKEYRENEKNITHFIYFTLPYSKLKFSNDEINKNSYKSSLNKPHIYVIPNLIVKSNLNSKIVCIDE